MIASMALGEGAWATLRHTTKVVDNNGLSVARAS